MMDIAKKALKDPYAGVKRNGAVLAANLVRLCGAEAQRFYRVRLLFRPFHEQKAEKDRKCDDGF